MSSPRDIISSLTKKTNDTDFNIDNKIQVFKTLFKGHDDDTINKISDYLDLVILDAKKYVAPKGSIGDLITQHAGILYFYNEILTDIKQGRIYLEKKLDQIQSKIYKYYMYDPEAKAQYGVIKTTDANKLTASTDEVVDLQNKIRKIAYYQHHVEILVQSLSDIKFSLHDLMILKKENLEDSWVGPTR